MSYPVICPACGVSAVFRTSELGERTPLWVCPDGHGAVRRAGRVPAPRQSSTPAAAPLAPAVPATV